MQIETEIKKDVNLNEINVEGFVEIINGDNKIKAKNKLVQSMLAWFANMTSIYGPSFGGAGAGWSLGTNGYQMYIGTDTTTPTLYNATVLTSPIGTSPGLAPNSTGGSVTNPSNGVFRILFSTTWDAGTISGTVGEMALYLKVKGTLQGFQWNTYVSGTSETLQLISRLAAADGAFTPFVINTANPLTINWTMQFSFS